LLVIAPPQVRVGTPGALTNPLVLVEPGQRLVVEAGDKDWLFDFAASVAEVHARRCEICRTFFAPNAPGILCPRCAAISCGVCAGARCCLLCGGPLAEEP
jgi:hypothetical protein